MTTRQSNWQGSKWIRPEKRYAIYLRDGLACAYCGAGPDDSLLSLDHVVPHSRGGSNEATNLVTCCSRCNSSRGQRSVPNFARAVAVYLNQHDTAQLIVNHVRACTRRQLDLAAAKAILAARRAS